MQIMGLHDASAPLFRCLASLLLSLAKVECSVRPPQGGLLQKLANVGHGAGLGAHARYRCRSKCVQ